MHSFALDRRLWLRLCKLLGAMARKRTTIDERPGPLPEIRAEGESVTYALPLDRIAPGIRLVIRCSEAGSVWASITSEDFRNS